MTTTTAATVDNALATTIAELESQMRVLHDYVELKWQQRDYHAVIDGCIDLQLLSVELRVWKGME